MSENSNVAIALTLFFGALAVAISIVAALFLSWSMLQLVNLFTYEVFSTQLFAINGTEILLGVIVVIIAPAAAFGLLKLFD